jgi:transcriptional antiterminator
MTPEKVSVARQMYKSREHTVEAIAKTLGVSRKTIYRHLMGIDHLSPSGSEAGYRAANR